MPVAPATLRLSDIDPATLAADIGEALAKHLGRLAFAAAPGYTVHVDGPHGDTDLGMTAADLARYARGDDGLDGPVSDYALSLLALFEAPLRGDTGQHPEPLGRWLRGEVRDGGLDPASLVDRLALVIVAAFGREAIDDGGAVSPAQLAALGGVDPTYVRRLVRQGELPAGEDGVPAGDARRWLAGRGGVTGRA